jgi:hypothetical protein
LSVSGQSVVDVGAGGSPEGCAGASRC